MVTGTVIAGSGVNRVMTNSVGSGVMAKVIVLLAFEPSASRIAWRRDPGPLSLVLRTTKVELAAALAANGDVSLVDGVAVAVIRVPGPRIAVEAEMVAVKR